MSIAVACAAGSFRGAFVHGVLSAFAENGVRADAYAAASSAAGERQDTLQTLF